MCTVLVCGGVASVQPGLAAGRLSPLRWTKDQCAGLLPSQEQLQPLCVSPQFEAVDSGPILVIEWCPGAGAVSVNGLKHSQTRVKHGLVSRMTVPGDQRTQRVPKGDSGTGSDHGRIRCHPLFFGPVDTMSIWK